MIKVQSKDKRSPYSIEIVYEPRSEHAKQLNEYKKNGQYHCFIKSTWETSVILTGDTNSNLAVPQIAICTNKYKLFCHLTEPTR